MSVPLRLVLSFEKDLPAARVRRETSSSPLPLVLLLTSSFALPWHRPSIASFAHHSKGIDHPGDRRSNPWPLVRPVRKNLAMLIATSARGHVLKRPSKPAIGTMLANLGRDNQHMVLERQEEDLEGDWYIQVLFRDNNTYQLEYRDGVAAEHYQTQTASQEKVLAALIGWAAGKPDWREGFMWNNIGDMFTPEA